MRKKRKEKKKKKKKKKHHSDNVHESNMNESGIKTNKMLSLTQGAVSLQNYKISSHKANDIDTFIDNTVKIVHIFWSFAISDSGA